MPACRYGSDVHCVDCGVDTLDVGEFYMVRADVWPLDPLGGMLCVGCLERRIGRRLVPADFTDCPLNRARGSSERLRSRLGGGAGRTCHTDVARMANPELDEAPW
jgi:hypothetical protein